MFIKFDTDPIIDASLDNIIDIDDTKKIAKFIKKHIIYI